jgi:hypothetical protein
MSLTVLEEVVTQHVDPPQLMVDNILVSDLKRRTGAYQLRLTTLAADLLVDVAASFIASCGTVTNFANQRSSQGRASSRFRGCGIGSRAAMALQSPFLGLIGERSHGDPIRTQFLPLVQFAESP